VEAQGEGGCGPLAVIVKEQIFQMKAGLLIQWETVQM